MTVAELRELLEDLPDDSTVRIRHELIGDEQYAESIAYDEKHNVVWMCETP